MQLSRAGEAGKITDCKLGVVGISNKIQYKDRMDERVKSSLCEREFVFPPYDANQLREIMQARADAFHDDVLEPSTIPRAAALAARANTVTRARPLTSFGTQVRSHRVTANRRLKRSSLHRHASARRPTDSVNSSAARRRTLDTSFRRSRCSRFRAVVRMGSEPAACTKYTKTSADRRALTASLSVESVTFSRSTLSSTLSNSRNTAGKRGRELHKTPAVGGPERCQRSTDRRRLPVTG